VAGRRQSRARREQAVRRAAEAGVEQAANEAGVTPATVRRWCETAILVAAEAEPIAVESEPAPAADDAPTSAVGAPADLERDDTPLDRIEWLRRDASRARGVVARAIRETERLLDAGKANDARNAAASGGIWADKAARLEELIQAEEDRRVRIAEGQGELVAALLELFLRDALRVPLADAARRVLRRLLEAADAGAPLVVDPSDGERAAGELRERVAAELRDVTGERRGLPSPADAGELVEGEVVDVGGARG
jgi:hypothetical protein